MDEQLLARRFVKIRHVDPRRLGFMAHAPDSAAGLIAFGMVPRHFVVRNDLVIPVHDVKAAVRAELDRNRAEPRIAATDEVGQVLEAPAVAVIAYGSSRGNEALTFLKGSLSLLTSAATHASMQSNGLNHSRDGIGDVEDVAVLARKAVTAFAQRQTAEACAAHLAFAECRERPRVGTRHVVGAVWV